MKCSFCGFEFDEKCAVSSCEGCLLKKKCRLVKCPNCGYEMPKTPEWMGKISKQLSVIRSQLMKKGK